MSVPVTSKRIAALLVGFLCLNLSLPLVVRPQSSSTSEQGEEVIRVHTELVQTDLMVFDRRGRFVDGLTPDQFVLTLNSTRRPVQLLSRVTAGSVDEASQLSAGRSR